MSLSSSPSLGALRIQALERADLENSPAISTREMNQYISNSYKRLYDMLVSAYGNNYYVKVPYQFGISGTQLYPLPSDFYKLLGVDLQYSASPTGWVTLKRFEFIERNKFSFLNPLPIYASNVQLWYIPEPTPLQFMMSAATTMGSAVVTVPDVADLVFGMSVAGTGVASSTTILSINAPLSQVTLSSAVTLTQPVATLSFWIDSATIDGVSGWEEFVIIDAAIKARMKQEEDVNDLRISKQEMILQIEALAEGRDAGQAFHTSDVMQINTPVINTGATNLKYGILGTNIMFVPAGYDDQGAGYGGYGVGF